MRTESLFFYDAFPIQLAVQSVTCRPLLSVHRTAYSIEILPQFYAPGIECVSQTIHSIGGSLGRLRANMNLS